MKKEEKEVLEKWVKLIKDLFEDAEFIIKDEEDFTTNNYEIAVDIITQNYKRIIIAVPRAVIDCYLALPMDDRKIRDKKFYQCIKDEHYIIKLEDLDLDYQGIFGKLTNCFKKLFFT